MSSIIGGSRVGPATGERGGDFCIEIRSKEVGETSWLENPVGGVAGRLFAEEPRARRLPKALWSPRGVSPWESGTRKAGLLLEERSPLPSEPARGVREEGAMREADSGCAFQMYALLAGDFGRSNPIGF